ncbi:PH domain-containing protein [Halobacterium zhouii]|uniref:PH domain-containing protein n=1 Tax=Halobacterium zhouii TaxID=2902624 RepID=UPI001E590EE3|nr:PH domain-containing protein [Halobacterium zhouii]
MASDQTAADGRIEIFDDEELLHDIQPSFVGAMSALDWILVPVSFGAWLLVPYLRWKHTRYIITSNRLIDMQGSVTGSTTVETRYDDVSGDIRTSQGLLEKLVDKGTVEFEIERVRGESATEREFGERDGSQREMAIDRESIELNGIREYQAVSNTVRRLRNA